MTIPLNTQNEKKKPFCGARDTTEPELLPRSRHYDMYDIMKAIHSFRGRHFFIGILCMCSFGPEGGERVNSNEHRSFKNKWR